MLIAIGEETWLRVGFFTDEHRPYHYGPAVNLSLQILEAFDPHILIVGSDGLEFRPVSHYTTDPTIWTTLMVEKESFWVGLREKRDACPGAELVYIAGNHGDRWNRYLETSGLRADPDFHLQHFLKLAEKGVRYELEDKLIGIEGLSPFPTITTRYDVSPKFSVMHGEVIRKWAGMSAKCQLVEQERMQTSLMMGHCHRGGKFEMSDRAGVAIGAYECYHHQRLDMPWLRGRNPDWQWGIALAEVQVEPPYYFSVEQVNYIRDNTHLRARWRGKEYCSK